MVVAQITWSGGHPLGLGGCQRFWAGATARTETVVSLAGKIQVPSLGCLLWNLQNSHGFDK